MSTLTRRNFVAGAAAASVAGMAGTAFADEAGGARMAQSDAGWLEDEPEIADVVDTVEVEALVIGAGTGGLEVGASLAEKGIKTLIIE